MVCSFSVLHSETSAQDAYDEIELIRNTFYQAVENEEKVDSLQSLIFSEYSRDTGNYPPVILGYYAGIEALNSKHAFWPLSKYSHFKESMKIFEQAVKKDPDNLEIRFLRFSVLHYVPSILGHSRERENDADKIVELLLDKQSFSITDELRNNIVEFMIDSERLTAKQENALADRFTIASYE